MDETVREFLSKHRTAARWLDDIIEVLVRFRGTAHVNTIARELSKSYTRDIDTVEQTVTRRINDLCSDARDFKKGKEHDLFERVEPATYRLRSYPEKPNIIELIRIEFDDPMMQGMWRTFADIAQKKNHENWSAANNEQKLTAFVRWMSKEKVHAEYERRKAEFDKAVNEIDVEALLTTAKS
jgi:hypothetical protein